MTQTPLDTDKSTDAPRRPWNSSRTRASRLDSLGPCVLFPASRDSVTRSPRFPVRPAFRGRDPVPGNESFAANGMDRNAQGKGMHPSDVTTPVTRSPPPHAVNAHIGRVSHRHRGLPRRAAP